MNFEPVLVSEAANRLRDLEELIQLWRFSHHAHLCHCKQCTKTADLCQNLPYYPRGDVFIPGVKGE